jgi:hypothetical protein
VDKNTVQPVGITVDIPTVWVFLPSSSWPMLELQEKTAVFTGKKVNQQQAHFSQM